MKNIITPVTDEIRKKTNFQVTSFLLPAPARIIIIPKTMEKKKRKNDETIIISSRNNCVESRKSWKLPTR